MRSSRDLLRSHIREMHIACRADWDTLHEACAVELGLEVAQRLNRNLRVCDVWPLLSGYPFARWARIATTPEHTHMLRLARQELWTLASPTSWSEAVNRYNLLDEAIRGFDRTSWSDIPRRRELAVAKERWEAYAQQLMLAAPLEGRALKAAEPGRYSFFHGRNRVSVRLPDLAVPPPEPHDLAAQQPLGGAAIGVTKKQLTATAKAMEVAAPDRWPERLDSILFEAMRDDRFVGTEDLTIDGLTHLLGIVGGGKSTLRDVLAVHLATQSDGRVTVVVNDVAEVLKCVERYNACLEPHGKRAAPIIGMSGRPRHLYRLHRRIAGRGTSNLLDHQDPGFDYLSIQCLLNPILVDQENDPIEYDAAPCERLYAPKRSTPPEQDDDDVEWSTSRRACPLWNKCGRHEGARRLRDADIWVTTPASLIDSRIPWAQNSERVQYLEAAVRRSDLIIVDEADRVQVQLDEMFAPAITLAGQGARSWVDMTSIHKSGEFSEHARVQLSNQAVETWNSSMHGVALIADQLHAKLVQEGALRKWLPAKHFSSWRLLQKLLIDRYGHASVDDDTGSSCHAPRQAITDTLDAFRDNPYGDRRQPDDERWDEDRTRLQRDLVTLTGQILHSRFENFTRQETIRVYSELFDRDLAGLNEEQRKLVCMQFEFFLRLAALEANLGTVIAMWPRVRAVMRLPFNELYRRPAAFGPMVPEAPMGNVLGFQFQQEDEDEQGRVRGQLRFFLCSGVGRSLLTALPELPTIDGRPGPNVMLMSGSSWAGRSARYHLRAPVSALIKPKPPEGRPTSAPCVFQIEPLWASEGPLTLSGSDLGQRFEVLQRMTVELGRDGNAGKLGTEISRIVDAKRKRVLLLVGSFDEAQHVADCLHNLHRRWHGRVFRLVSDDAEDDAHATQAANHHSDIRARILRRGDVDRLGQIQDAEILVAPLLAVERGHNILVKDTDYAAIGSVYFLARPQPRPDDLGLTVNIVNDWIHRIEPEAEYWLTSAESLDVGARRFRQEGRKRWHEVLSGSFGWRALSRPGREDDRASVTWDLLVLIWQVIGRLVRGGVEARVVFTDAAFAPRWAEYCYRNAGQESEKREFLPDDVSSSLLVSIKEQLDSYLAPGMAQKLQIPQADIQIVEALYKPVWVALTECLTEITESRDE
ncbi:hypothetical protein GZH49_28625 [Nocardia terpenica]|uniref:pPIWI_RE_Z domain-containing protein n=1 Tax=Nocardia terpenica TaxID=455432 RepID=UPI002FE1C5B6